MSSLLKIHVRGVLLLVLVFDGLFSCSSSSDNSNGTVDISLFVSDCQFSCGLCGDPINITLVFNNILEEPFFSFNVTIHDKPQRQLIFFLEAAAKMEVRARFTGVYWGSLGYYIETINNLKASVEEETFWYILDQTTGVGLNLGVSSYVPEDQQILEFNFTTYAVLGDH